LCFEKNKNKLKQTLEEMENKSPEVCTKIENTAHYDAVLKKKQHINNSFNSYSFLFHLVCLKTLLNYSSKLLCN